MVWLSVSAARATLPEVLDRVTVGDEVTITRHGQPVAVLVRPDELRTRRAEATIRRARQVADLLSAAGQQSLAVLLVPEILAEPMREGHAEELTALAGLLNRLELRVVDAVTAEVATSLAASHRLRAADAVHLATAILAGADRFLTTNRRDFPDSLTDIEVTYPDTLPAPSAR